MQVCVITTIRLRSLEDILAFINAKQAGTPQDCIPGFQNIETTVRQNQPNASLMVVVKEDSYRGLLDKLSKCNNNIIRQYLYIASSLQVNAFYPVLHVEYL